MVYIYLILYSYLSQRYKHCARLHSRFSDGQCKSLHALCVQPLRWWRSCGQPSLSPQCLKDKAGCLRNVYNDNKTSCRNRSNFWWVKTLFLQCSPSLNQLTSCGSAGVKEHCKLSLLPSVTQVGGKVFKKWASCSGCEPKRGKEQSSWFGNPLRLCTTIHP